MIEAGRLQTWWSRSVRE